jgi:predicted amidophosphoribosyltransferase
MGLPRTPISELPHVAVVPHTVWCPTCEAPQVSSLKVCSHCGKPLAADDLQFLPARYWLIVLAAAAALTLWMA